MAEPVAAASIERDGMIRVLVVDDHQVFAESLARAVAGEPDMLVCGVAADRAGAARAAARDRPDVVLLDYALGIDDGPETASAIRRVCEQARVVILTGLTDAATFQRSMKAGCAGVLAKTDGLDEVIAAIREAHDGRTVVSTSLAGARQPRLELTGRELDVVRLLAAGRSTRQIADELFLSLHTVRNYIQRSIEKLGAHSKLEAVATALRLGLVSSPTLVPTGRASGRPSGVGPSPNTVQLERH